MRGCASHGVAYGTVPGRYIHRNALDSGFTIGITSVSPLA
jgi:hypothetical protein